jgi:hypothetical protein
LAEAELRGPPPKLRNKEVIGVPELLEDVKFLRELELEDRRVAEQYWLRGCRHCGGRLHQAHYPRKVRGISDSAAAYFERRYSFCCARCRKRETPPSLRFESCFVYAAVAVLVAGMLAVQTSVTSAARQVGAARRTVSRWRRWFQRTLPTSEWWKRHSGHFREPPDADRMPVSLVEQIAGATKTQQALRALRLLSGARISTVDAFTQRMLNSPARSAP